MREIKGKCSSAKIYTDNIEGKALDQILELCNSELSLNSQIRVMPDCHAGKGCVIGLTMNINDKICPNLVGVDIGCGMTIHEIPKEYLDNVSLEQVDNFIRNNIPHGTAANDTVLSDFSEVDDLKCIDKITKVDRIKKSLGSLGAGNHFIEIGKGKDNFWLVVHSGSRNLGHQVANIYQHMAIEQVNSFNSEMKLIIEKLKVEGRESEIQDVINNLKNKEPLDISNHLCYLQQNPKEGKPHPTGYEDYIHDLMIVQRFASENRKIIVNKIIKFIEEHQDTNNDYQYKTYECIHNYIDKDKILRKGAISSHENEDLIIPINMRDGVILAKGCGNKDWNESAPHGAGRIMSRTKAIEELNMEDFKDQMSGIYTTSVVKETLDEAPNAYKPIQEIIDNIKGTAIIEEIVKPVYNFKSNK